MSRYDRPGATQARRRRRGRAAERWAFLTERAGDADPEDLRRALDSRRRQLAPARDVARTAPAGVPPAGDPGLWVPIGPTVVVEGQAGGRPRVAGRVRDLQVSPDGQRAYAATANGGVWYTGDGGESWAPLGGWAVSGTPPTTTTAANVLVCGCVRVTFDPGGNAALDEVLVGTGELLPWLQGTPGARAFGVGVLRAVGPATAPVFSQVWNVEGTNLAGRGIFGIAADPGAATTLVAATSLGLWTRTGAPAATWTVVPAAPFNAPGGDQLICTDVVWTATRLWVAVRDDTGGASGLHVSTAGTAGPFTPVALPGLVAQSRITLAPAPSNNNVLYALANGNQVWRIDGIVPTPLNRIPPNLLGGQDNYNQTIAVHPTRPERIVLGGATEQADGEWSASLYVGNVTGPTAGAYRFGFTRAPGADPTTDDSYVGHGVHADVHAAQFAPAAAGGAQLWIGCDGGVFRSNRADADNRDIKHSFIERNTGIAALECGYVASHPDADGYMLAGTQDNGTIERIGDTVWRGRFLGDGGGVAFNPVARHRFLRQYIRATWRSEGFVGTVFTNPVLRSTGAASTANAIEAGENRNASFYTGVDAVANGAAARLAFGTYRVWMSDDWGRNWLTLPSLTDPMALGSQNANTDAVVSNAGLPVLPDSRVAAVRWASASRLYVLCARAVMQYDIVVDAGQPSGLRCTPTPLTRQAPGKCEDPQAAATVASPGQVLPAVGQWSDLAVHDPARGSHGSFYVATTGAAATPAMDTLWWFDGDDRWHATGLRTDANGVTAPAYAVVADGADVYVGTSVGVWKGTLRAGETRWDWRVFSNGLPEASIHDLTIARAGGTRLLRAGVQARGVWEVDLAADGTARTFVRVHRYDARRAATVSLSDPQQPVPNTLMSWHASPDVRVRPRRGNRPPAPVGLPWNGASADVYGLWTFQTALHGRGDPLVRPTGLWTPLFSARLRAATSANRVTNTVWRNIVGQGAAFPDAYADPWNATSPSEADVIELVRDLPAPVGSPASVGMRAARARVDVLVHHRHPTPVAAADVRVTLLRRAVTGTAPAAWAVLPGAWAALVQAHLRTPAALPALPDGWTFADGATPVRSPGQPVDARLPRAVTFDVDFSGRAVGDRILLLAVVHSAADPVTLPAQPLQQLVLGTRFAALRSVEIA